jgi:ZIP family zinc transporter
MTTVLLAAVAAAVAAVLGAILPRWRRPSTLVSSVVLGFASGVMTGAVTFTVLPQALQLASLMIVAVGFAVGFAVVYGFDLIIHRGKVAGEHAAQKGEVKAEHERKRPLGGPAMVLAAGAVFESAIEGVSLGVASALGPGLTLPLAIAITIDNLSEGLSLSTLPEDTGDDTDTEIEQENGQGSHSGRPLWWSVGIGVVTVIAAVVGWFALRGAPAAVHGGVFAAGGGAIFYLTITELVPEAESEHYQESSAVATGIGLLVILILAEMG